VNTDLALPGECSADKELQLMNLSEYVNTDLVLPGECSADKELQLMN